MEREPSDIKYRQVERFAPNFIRTSISQALYAFFMQRDERAAGLTERPEATSEEDASP